MGRLISCIEPLRSGPLATPDPFLFCVYHNDNYPAGDGKMQAPRRGNGADFDPSGPYRMYHGERVPGFPSHPHRGFETITATLTGLIDHTDSHGNGGRYGHGDLQWMTAGRGVQHAEMFPLVNTAAPNPLRFFQLWLNLPAKSKMVEPAFRMHWAEEVPKASPADGVQVTVWAGEFGGVRALPPPPDSYASSAASDLAVFHISLAAGAQMTLPPAAGGGETNRCAYFVEGAALEVVDEAAAGRPDVTRVTDKSIVTLAAEKPALLRNPTSGGSAVEVLVLQGRPLGEPVAQQGPFVMNTEDEIRQAFADYRATQFGGWPWPRPDEVFGAEKGRFARFNGQETGPPPCSTSDDA
jgi:redox-sensitive bicupin YhaK (pirin superfamily)